MTWRVCGDRSPRANEVQYVGPDVSVKSVSICVVDTHDAVLTRGETASDPDRIVSFIREHEPRAFRQRSKETAYAEVDLTAEGKTLLFSRWNFQCKCIKGRVSLGDVAKEVGLAIYSKAHVVAVVTTSGFSKDAINYAREITSATHLQFVLVDGSQVRSYLDSGPTALLDFVTRNAADVMATKRNQPIDPGPVD